MTSTVPLAVLAKRLAVEGALAGVGFAFVLAKMNPWLIAGIVAVLYGARLVGFADRAQRIYFLGFGALWALLDVGFVQAGVFAYAEPSAIGPPVYMPFIFCQLALLVAETLGPLPVQPTRLPLRVDVILLAIATAAVLLLHDRASTALAIGLAIALVLRAAASRFAVPGLALVVGFGIGEPLIEALLIKLGMFTFRDPYFLGLPAWYPLYFAFLSYGVARAIATAARTLRPELD